MIVLLDIGNTRAKYCLIKNKQRSVVVAISNEQLNDGYFNQYFKSAEKILVASVASEKYTDRLNAWCQNTWVPYQRVRSEHSRYGVKSAYQDASKLGVDRWLALLGAAKLYPAKNILIVDSGTATTFDLLSVDGQHQGGWILAGIDMLINSILVNTTQVEAEEHEQENIAFGTNTSENVHHAAWAATVGAINMAIIESEQQGDKIDEIILTGGNSHKLSTLLSAPHVVIENLVFRGLQTYLEN